MGDSLRLDLPWRASAEMPTFRPPVGFLGSVGTAGWDPVARSCFKGPPHASFTRWDLFDTYVGDGGTTGWVLIRS